MIRPSEIMLFAGMIRTPLWRTLTAVAFMALAIVVARPVCEAAEAMAIAAVEGTMQAYAGHQDHQGEIDLCCASVEEAATLFPASWTSQSAKLPPLAAAQLTWQQKTLSERWRTPVDCAPLRCTRSYHARSGRLLL